MHRFLFHPDERKNDLIYLDEEESRHLIKVLRLNVSDEVIAFDGQGQEFKATIVEKSSSKVILSQLVPTGFMREAPIEIELVQGIAKGEKMDWIIQKATELGVHRITPVFTERTVVHLDEKKARERQGRWQKIAREAAKQSWRTIVPHIEIPQKLLHWYDKSWNKQLLIIPWEEEKSKGLKEVVEQLATNRPSQIALLIGPEGGITETEVTVALQKGAAHSVRLGPRILRTETAAVAALALLNYELGDWG
ncbi:16S rRNA (uracil(1498)-N(3))-methyltransferase [Heliorestis acidaminivorans]|nr:16S rRNA (uracil(1498)-N(3))-methyltransferase [Heliorestis acidaminivorans]